MSIKRLDVCLRGPICNCEEQNLTTSIAQVVGLTVECATCHIKVNVPYKKIVAQYVLDKPYPKDDEPDGDFVVSKTNPES